MAVLILVYLMTLSVNRRLNTVEWTGHNRWWIGKKCKKVEAACLKYVIMLAFNWKYGEKPHNLSIRAVGSWNLNWTPPTNKSKCLRQNCSMKKVCRGTKDRTPNIHSPVTCCFRHSRFGLLQHKISGQSLRTVTAYGQSCAICISFQTRADWQSLFMLSGVSGPLTSVNIRLGSRDP